MNLRYILLGSILILAALSGCTGGGEDKGASGDADVTTTTEAAPTTTTTEAAPVTTVPAALHGVGKCDACHAAPSMDEWKGGLMATAFEKNPGHKDMCKGCHTDIETFCAQSECHPLPSIMAPEGSSTPAADDTSAAGNETAIGDDAAGS